MNDFLIPAITVINEVANIFGGFCLSPVAILPGWLSINIISALLGILLIVIFKYTSNQKAIVGIRDDIKANILAIKLYKESFSVASKSQVSIFLASFKLLFHSIVPMIFLIVPVSLILVQMGMWFQLRPARTEDEPIVVKMKLNNDIKAWPPHIKLHAQTEIFKTIGKPVRVFSKKEIYWKIKPQKVGRLSLIFEVENHQYKKQLTVGDGFMRQSYKKPSRNIADIFLYPLEKPFPSDSIVDFISIDYPKRDSKMYGTDWWLIYFFIASMIFAFLFTPFLKVRV